MDSKQSIERKEYKYPIAERENILNPPEPHKTIGFQYGSQKKDNFNWLF